MRRARLLAIVPLFVLAFTGIAHANELEVLTKFGGTELAINNGSVLELVTFKSPSTCVFEETEGNLLEQHKDPVSFGFSHLKEHHCEAGAIKTRFYVTEISALSGDKIETESNSTDARIREGSCLWGIRKMSNSTTFSIPGWIVAEVTGTGVLKEGPSECGTTKSFTAELELLNEKEKEKENGRFEEYAPLYVRE